jgi:GTP-binding protein EngB required for normal cell division
LGEAVLLLDGRNGPTELDGEALNFLMKSRLRLRVVMTKVDQLKTQSERHRRKKEVEGVLLPFGVIPERIHWVSAARGQGIPELVRAIREENQ